MSTGLLLKDLHVQAMLEHVLACLPEEACGLLIGADNQVEQVAAVTNALHSTVRYRMDPQEQYNWLMWMDEHHQELLAIFHSHPAGPAVPSETDLKEYYYPDAVMIIWSPVGGHWEMRGFKVEDQQAREIDLWLLDAR